MARNVSMERRSEHAKRALCTIMARGSSAGETGTSDAGVSHAAITTGRARPPRDPGALPCTAGQPPPVAARYGGWIPAHRVRRVYRYPLIRWSMRRWMTGPHRSAVLRRRRRGGGDGLCRSVGSAASNWPAPNRPASNRPSEPRCQPVPWPLPAAGVAFVAIAERGRLMTRTRRC